MIVMGIHDGHCASACIMVDGRLKAVAAEERFTRLKNDCGYPLRAIDYCLRQIGITANDIDQVAVATENLNAFYTKLKGICSFTNEDWISIHRDYWKPLLYEGRENPAALKKLHDQDRFQRLEHYYDFSEIDASYEYGRDREKVRAIRLNGIKSHLGISAEKVRFYDHHSCHAYYALFGSHIRDDNTMIYTLDGGGDGAVSTLFRFNRGGMEELARSNVVDIARIYREMTLMMGMKLGEHEYKVMGLAPYATEREVRKSWAVFDGMFEIKDDMIAYSDGRKPKDLYYYFQEAFEGHRFDGIAAAMQLMAEDTVCRWVREMQKKYSSNTAVFAGGVAMNVKLNMLLAEDSGLKDFYVCPSPGDDTLCIGACYMAETGFGPAGWHRLQPVIDPYLGPVFDSGTVSRAIREAAIEENFKVERGIGVDRITDLLVKGMVVARCCGRMELGSRALGNRSILADPRNSDIVEKINRQIKYRDFWMPFAPVVLEERVDEYLIRGNRNIRRPYMMIACPTTTKGREELEGSIHKGDYTARPQVVRREENPAYYDIIKAFEMRTGTGALLNTSFNLHGEPIVCSPEDAISTFLRSELDALVLNDVLIIR